MSLLSLPDDGKVLKVVSIPKEDLGTDEIILEELTVFQVRSSLPFPDYSLPVSRTNKVELQDRSSEHEHSSQCV